MILTGTSEGQEMSLPPYYCTFRCKTKVTIQIILQCAAVLYLFCLCLLPKAKLCKLEQSITGNQYLFSLF